MARTPHTPTPENAEQAKIWLDADLLAWVDAMAERDQRSRSFIINQGLTQWRRKLESDRERRRKR